jgi:hypothetical protein
VNQRSTHAAQPLQVIPFQSQCSIALFSTHCQLTTFSYMPKHVHNVSPEIWSSTHQRDRQYQSPLYYAIAYYHNNSQRSNAPTSCLDWPSAEQTSTQDSTLLPLESMQHSEMPCIHQAMVTALESQAWYHLPMILMIAILPPRQVERIMITIKPQRQSTQWSANRYHR